MNKKFIINADDYGLSPGVSRGILELFRSGAVSSTSVLVNQADCVEQLQELMNSGLPAGIHLNLTTGKPVLPAEKVPSLVNSKGRFHDLKKLWLLLQSGRLNPEEIRLELSAQVERMSASLKPDHFDGHQHFYFFSKKFARIVFPLMRDFGIRETRLPFESRLFPGSHPVLVAKTLLLNWSVHKIIALLEKYNFSYPDSFFGQQFCGRWSLRDFTRVFRHAEGVTEIMVHPGFCDDLLRKRSRLSDQRERELEVLRKIAGKISLDSFGEI
ncbi:MAG: ChbG/HpnK family deacetylase [Candidatus Wallbacteria bacterium]|nr:ChbG/HpnK family deacetylase [Candidatus Wallbacteria bacterium]